VAWSCAETEVGVFPKERASTESRHSFRGVGPNDNKLNPSLMEAIYETLFPWQHL